MNGRYNQRKQPQLEETALGAKMKQQRNAKNNTTEKTQTGR